MTGSCSCEVERKVILLYAFLTVRPMLAAWATERHREGRHGGSCLVDTEAKVLSGQDEGTVKYEIERLADAVLDAMPEDPYPAARHAGMTTMATCTAS